MHTTIRELRPDDIELALALAQAAGQSLEPQRVHRACSLLACVDQTPVAAALCLDRTRADPTLLLCIHPDHHDTQLEHHLLDKAMLKLRAGGMRTCHLQIQPTDPIDHELLPTLRWPANVPQTMHNS